jgi:hypothetical protein
MTTKYVLAFGLLLAASCRSATPPADTTTPHEGVFADAGSDACPTKTRCAWSRGRIERLPVLVLEEHGGWSSYDETDAPAFALYDDGLVLFVDGEGKDARVLQAQLSAAEVDAIVRDAHAKLDGVPDQIEGSSATDQPSARVHLATRGPTRDVFAWGIDRDGKPTSSGASIPSAFVELYLSLRKFAATNATPWIPDEIAIRLHPRDDFDDAAAWPNVLPEPPEHATTTKPLIYRIDGSLEDEVVRALAILGEVPTVQWNGRAWVVHVSRVVPG